ncbi:MAG TPA: 50S ribosomal protein L3 [Planctomycetota bacterium]|nr:50S ribosomal protein L3 [Planctomycetota bacterium]
MVIPGSASKEKGTMITGLLGRKAGMTQVFTESGEIIPVTVIELGPCTVMQVKRPETDGYYAVQVGFADKRRKLSNRPMSGHARKANTEPKRFIKEIRWDGQGDYQLGQKLTVEIFNETKTVDVSGKSKGKGFAGGVKRHHFKGGPVTHGQSDRTRAPGSIGSSSDPSRVYKGLRMAGRMGGRTTMRNLVVVKVDPDNNCLLVKGAVPGPTGGYVEVRRAKAHRSA